MLRGSDGTASRADSEQEVIQYASTVGYTSEAKKISRSYCNASVSNPTAKMSSLGLLESILIIPLATKESRIDANF